MMSIRIGLTLAVVAWLTLPSWAGAPEATPGARAATTIRSGEIIVYNGGSPKTSVPTVWGTWGGGEVTSDAQNLYDLDAKESLHVVTYDYFQGARLDLADAIDITPYRERGYLILRMRFPGLQAAPGTAGGTGAGSQGSGLLGGAGALGGSV